MSFSVSVLTLLGSPTYQWYFNNSKIYGATGSSLTLTNVSVPNIGNYYVAVSDGILGAGNSGTATLTVTDLPPTVNGDAYTVHQNVKLTVSTPGVLINDSPAFAGPLTAMLVTNASHGTLSFYTNGGFTYLPATNYYGTDSFSYIASDGMSNSAPATVSLTIVAPPSITTQPLSQAVVTNQNATFTVAASGTMPLSYQWYRQGSMLAGATNSTLTISNVANNSAGRYSVILTNVAGSVTSASATLTVVSLPVVSTLAASSVTTNSAVLNAALNPNGAATSYYFQYGLTTNYDLVTQTNTQPSETDDNVAVTLANLAPGTVYHYSVVAANPAGLVVGADATFQTAFLPPKVTFVDADGPTASSVTLKARMNPEGTSATYYFQYGPTMNYSSFTATNMLAAITNGVNLAIAVSGLTPGTIYYYSFVAVGAGGTTISTNGTFSTVSVSPIQLSAAVISQGSALQNYMQLSFTNVPGASFTVLCSPDLALPLTSWVPVGPMTEVSPGQYQFTDPHPATNARCFYSIQSQ